MEFLVFEDLTKSKGLFITDGLKFGADFLAYKGDPLLFHAKFLVKISHHEGEIPVLDLIVHQRMANANKKTLLIAYRKDDLI